MRGQKLVLITMAMVFSLFIVAQTPTSRAMSKKDTTTVANIYVTTKSDDNKDNLIASLSEKNDKQIAKTAQIPPTTNHKKFLEESSDEFGEDVDADFEVPSDELYGFSWTSEYLNPYKIKIDDLPDSTWIDCTGFVFPVAKSTEKKITSDFGARRRRYHYGTDIGLKVGDTIVAAFDGTVRIVDYEARGYGHYIVIRHKNGLESLYAHLSKPLVTVNQEVAAGELIGLGGNTGRSTGPHLHFEFRFLGNAFNTNKIVDYASEKCFADSYCLTKAETFRHKSDVEKFKQMRYHRVRQGETLSHIAKRYGTTVNKLCKLNHISRTTIIRSGRSIRYR